MRDRSKKVPEVKDEPGAEDRFLRGVNKALRTPPKPFTPAKGRPRKGEAKEDGKK